MNATRLTIGVLSLLTVGRIFAAEGAGRPDIPRPASVVRPNMDKPAVSSAIVEAHNSVRNKVGVPPLAWSDELAQVAQNWAERLVASGAFEHSRTGKYGENIFEVSGTGWTSNAQEVVGNWAAESGNYQYPTNTCTGVCGHYTQLVWKDTKEVGCGVARDNNREVWVCNYAPYGNIIGEKPY